jgi:hypothetical protein
MEGNIDKCWAMSWVVYEFLISFSVKSEKVTVDLSFAVVELTVTLGVI